MKKHKCLAILRHAVMAARRNIKSYALLSVTIVLSYALLLGYLLYTDSSLYNQYKETFRLSRSIVITSPDLTGNTKKLQILQEKAAELGDTFSMLMYESYADFITFNEHDDGGTHSTYHLYAIPDHAWGMYLGSLEPKTILWLDGEAHQDVNLAADEALMSEGIFYALGLDAQEVPTYRIRISDNMQVKFSMTVKIVGLIEDEVPLRSSGATAFDVELNSDYLPFLVVPMKVLDFSRISGNPYVVFHTDRPEEIAQLVESFGFYPQSVYASQNQALEAIRLEKSNKAIIACALLLLLGINLYSSFTNALNDRKFEIGVKRAIGASGFSIVRQFLYESLIVMAANILLAVVLVADVFIVYKFIYERIPDEWGKLNRWIIYISPQSAAMFAVCAVSLTIVFSLIFAYKSTRVEIVQYLKAE